jgi:hypothetical protein
MTPNILSPSTCPNSFTGFQKALPDMTGPWTGNDQSSSSSPRLSPLTVHVWPVHRILEGFFGYVQPLDR